MGIIELFLFAVSLSMDAFAVSVCKGLSVKTLRPRHGVIAGLYFGGFQALMPLIGWLLGRQFEGLIKSVDHWVAFVLLALIGANMVRESFGKDEEVNDSFSFKTMLPLAVALCLSGGADSPRYRAYRRNDLRVFGGGRENRQRVRHSVQVKGRAGRRRHPYPARHQNTG